LLLASIGVKDLKREIAALHPAEVAQALPKGFKEWMRCDCQPGDARLLTLLRLRRFQAKGGGGRCAQ
jgi:hypothetical protein